MKKAIKKNMFLSFMLIVSAAVILWPHIKKFLLTDFVLPKLNTYVNENIPSGFNLKIEKMSFNIFSGFSFEDLRLLSDNVEVLRASTADIDLSLSDALNKRCGLLIKDIVFKVENNVLLTKGNCEVFVEKGKIEIRSVTGHILGQRFHYSGKIAYSGEKEVLLNGTWAQIKNNFKLSIVSGNRAMLDWDGKSGGTWFRVHGVSNDFDSMLFDINAEGKVKIEDFLKKYSLTGMVSFLGNLKGVVGKISSLSGNVSLQIRDCSRGNFTIPSMECNVRVAKGLAEIHVPHSQVYGGTITGMCVVDLNNLYSFNGIDAVIKNVDLEKLSVVSGYLKGISGILSGRIARAEGR